MSPNLARAMDILESNGNGDVIHLRDKFPETTKDIEWLHYVGRENMILITRDQNICKRPAELAALRENNVGAFILIGKNLNRWAQIKQLINHWEKIKSLANSTNRPFAFKVRVKGKIEQIPL